MLYINATILDDKPTGLGVYTINVIKHLKNDMDFKIFSPIFINNCEKKIIKTTRFVKPKYRKMGGLIRFLWCQFILPFKTNKNDIIYHPFQYLSFISRSKQIITIHDFIPIHYPEVAKHQYYYYKYIMPILLKKAYKIICISENTKNDLMKFYKNVDTNKISVLYNGVDSELFNTNNVDEKILKKYNINYEYVMMIGPSYKHKNMHTIIEVYEKLKNKLNYKLLIVGKNSEYKSYLKSLVDTLRLQENVIFLDYVDLKDLPTLYNKSKAFVYPSLCEGFGFPVVEATFSGACVYASNTTSIPEVIYKKENLFNPTDYREIEDLLLKIELNTKEKLYPNELKYYIEKFKWDNFIIRFIDVIK